MTLGKPPHWNNSTFTKFCIHQAEPNVMTWARRWSSTLQTNITPHTPYHTHYHSESLDSTLMIFSPCPPFYISFHIHFLSPPFYRLEILTVLIFNLYQKYCQAQGQGQGQGQSQKSKVKSQN